MSQVQQSVIIHATVHRVFEALTDSRAFAQWSGGKADLGVAAGDRFSIFDGRITGVNVDKAEDLRLVQAWRSTAWPTGVYSIVHFELEPCPDGTIVRLEQSGFPNREHEHLDAGWHRMYWEPLRRFFS